MLLPHSFAKSSSQAQPRFKMLRNRLYLLIWDVISILQRLLLWGIENWDQYFNQFTIFIMNLAWQFSALIGVNVVNVVIGVKSKSRSCCHCDIQVQNSIIVWHSRNCLHARYRAHRIPFLVASKKFSMWCVWGFFLKDTLENKYSPHSWKFSLCYYWNRTSWIAHTFSGWMLAILMD